MVDPVFEGSYSPISRRIIPIPNPDSYKDIDVVMITHAHPDHLSPRTLASFPESTIIICPEASLPYLRGLKQRIVSLQSYDIFTIKDLNIYAVPALHPGGRKSILKNSDGRALGYILQGDGKTIYISGDTEYNEEMRIIGKRFNPEIAILNINSHLTNKEAESTMQLIGAKTLIPAHHGAFQSPYASISKQWRRELQKKYGENYKGLEIGVSYSIDKL